VLFFSSLQVLWRPEPATCAKKTQINNHGKKPEEGHAFNMQILCFGNEASVVWPRRNRATFTKYQSHSSVVLLSLRFGIQMCLFFASQRQIECKSMTDVLPIGPHKCVALRVVRFPIDQSRRNASRPPTAAQLVGTSCWNTQKREGSVV